MEKLKATLSSIKQGQYPALMTHVVLGYPTLEKSIEIALAMADSGAAIIELQIPFSDPMADGPTIMKASECALAQGVRPKDCMLAMEKISSKTQVPVLFMSYFNLVFSAGVKQFCKDSAAAGAQGLIVPDLPPEDSTEGYWEAAAENKLAAIALVSPVTTKHRFELIKKRAKDGFVYCVSTTGTTGARNNLPENIKLYLDLVKNEINLPRALGFGISSKEQISSLIGNAEIAIVGSAMIDKIDKSKDLIKEVRSYTKELSGNE